MHMVFSLYQLRWIDCQKALVEYANDFFSLPAKVDWLSKSSLIDCQKPWNLNIVKLEVIKNWKKLLTMHMAFSLCQLKGLIVKKQLLILHVVFSLYQLRWIDCQKAVVEYAYGLFFSLPAKVDWLSKSSLIDCQKPWNLDIVKLEVIKNVKKLLTMHIAFSLCQLRWIDCQKTAVKYAYGFFSLPAKLDWLSKSSCWICKWFFHSTS